jgi:hypothetical protein
MLFIGKPRAPFIEEFVIALGSIKLEGSYTPFCWGD